MKFYFQNLTKRITLAATAVVVTATTVMGQVVISDNNPTVTNFNGWNGTMPTGWTRSGANYVGTSASTTGGVYAVANSGFGYQPSGTAPATTAGVAGTFQNNTGSTITSLRISYVAFNIVFRASRTPGWAVTSSLGTVSDLNWAYNSSSSAATPDSLGVILTGLNIANGTTFTLSFASDRGAGGGSSPMIGMNRVTITNLSTPLFIRLNEFKAANHGNVNDLTWTTATEDAGDMFEIERSADGRNFNKIAATHAKGAAPAAYGFADQNPLTGANYYRLKFLNSDGSVYYSKIVSVYVSGDKAAAVTVYPNPMTDKLNVAIEGDVSTAIEVSMVDGMGRECHRQTVTEAGIITISTAQLAPGIYFIRYNNGKEEKVIKVSK